MIVERITLLAIYRALKQLETNEGKIYDLVLNRKFNTRTVSPQSFKSLDDLLRFVQTEWPYQNAYQTMEICHWYPYAPVKFWVEKNNGTQVDFKTEIAQSKSNSLNSISIKRMRDLDAYLKNITASVDGLQIDPYIAPMTQTYVECVYIQDITPNKPYYYLVDEYLKYIKP